MDLLKQALTENHLALSEDTIQKLHAYLALMQKWNKVFNLTSITDEKDAVYLHIIDSLLIKPFLQGQHILDVGTGAGLPGIPLALVCPELSFSLLDSNSKKTKFLTQVILELGIKNVKVIHSRCEDFHLCPGFDTIMSRAFASLHNMIEGTAHLLKTDGEWLAMKGIYPEDELREIEPSFNTIKVQRLTLIGYPVERHVVCIKKP